MNMVLIAFVSMMVLVLLVITHGRSVAQIPLAATQVTKPLATEAAPMPVAETPVAATPVATMPSATSAPVAAEPIEYKATYTAQWGDTVSNLAAEMPGGNLKSNRDAVIHANESLRQNPDNVVAGTTYAIPADAVIPVPQATMAKEVEAAAPQPTVTAPVAAVEPVVIATPERADELTYVARAGDTVSVLANALLGANTKENRDAIVAANPSLQRNPDHLEDGQTYIIPVSESNPLAKGIKRPQAVSSNAGEGLSPDADDVISAGSTRDLRYVARPGDTVSTLAVALLGADTIANRVAIVSNNRSLVRDADHVVAGKTYWIAMPVKAK